MQFIRIFPASNHLQLLLLYICGDIEFNPGPNKPALKFMYMSQSLEKDSCQTRSNVSMFRNV